jgi:hypothetical protein
MALLKKLIVPQLFNIIAHIIWDQKVHHRIHNSMHPVPIPSHIIHSNDSHFFRRHFNLPSIFGSSKWFLFFKLHPPKSYTHLFPPPEALYVTPGDTSAWWAENILRFLFKQLSLFSSHFLPVRLKHAPHHPLRKHNQPMFFSEREKPRFTTIHNYSQIIIL